MTETPEWTYRQAEQMRDHWWWRPGWDVGKRFYTWHLTFDDQHDLYRLVDAYQQRLAAFPELDLVPRQWLHVTMQGVGFTHEIDQDSLTRIIKAAGSHLAEQPTFDVSFHRPVIRPEAVALPPHPLAPVNGVRTAIRRAMAEPSVSTRFPGQPRSSLTSASPTATASTTPQNSSAASTSSPPHPPPSPSTGPHLSNSTATTGCISGAPSPWQNWHYALDKWRHGVDTAPGSHPPG